MSKEKWWVIAPESEFAFEQRPNGDLVVFDRGGSEQHVLHGYEWMHRKDRGDIKVHGEGPPPFGVWQSC
jgi:hypothetical protein